WRCGICHKSCCCEECLEPEPTQEAGTRTQEEGEDEGTSEDNFAGEVVGQIGAVFADIERKVAEEKRAWRICFNRFKPETHGRCSHCGAEGGPGRWEERNLYEVVEHMVKPICAQLRVSYVELLRRGPEGEEMEGVKPDTFVSHWWGEEFPKFVRTLTCFAEARSRRLPWTVCTTPHRNPKTWAFWICAFANNQYAIEHALGDFSSDVTPRTAVMTSAFATALDAVSDVVAVLDDRAIIYTRIWCCFELFSVARLIPERDLAEFLKPRDLTKIAMSSATPLSQAARRRILADLNRLQEEPIPLAAAAPCSDADLSLWNGVIGTQMEVTHLGCVTVPLHFLIDFPCDYPLSAPNIGFSFEFQYRGGASYVQRDGRLKGKLVICLDVLGKGKELEIFIADESGVVSSGCGNVGMMNALIDKVKTAEAEASNPDDKAMIESAMLADGTTSE
ncbi:unnamed protein product, partial [Symbiodinium sp. CCMP2456]